MRKWLVPALVVAAVAAFVLWRFSPGTQTPTVVVYVSHDQVFSEPILTDFEKETGIKVRAIYDTEETKSTGTMNRLIAEKNNPQADVYWANEPVRAEVLRQQGIAAPYTLAECGRDFRKLQGSRRLLDRLRGARPRSDRQQECNAQSPIRCWPTATRNGAGRRSWPIRCSARRRHRLPRCSFFGAMSARRRS